jgi:serine/threonine protein kinase
MAPEQMRAMPVDVRTDIWGLGTVMFECVAGRAAFEGATVYEISARVLNAPPPDLSFLNPELPEAFVRVVNRCLEREPDDRFQNVADLARSLLPLAAPINDSTIDRIERLLGIQSSDPSIEASGLELEFDPVEDVEFTKRDIPGLQSHGWPWTLLLVPMAFLIAYFVFAHFRYPNELVQLLMSTWHRATMLVKPISR